MRSYTVKKTKWRYPNLYRTLFTCYILYLLLFRTVKLADFGMTRAMFEHDYYKFSRKGNLKSYNNTY